MFNERTKNMEFYIVQEYQKSPNQKIPLSTVFLFRAVFHLYVQFINEVIRITDRRTFIYWIYVFQVRFKETFIDHNQLNKYW